MIASIQVQFNIATNSLDFSLVSDDGVSSEWYISASGPNGVIQTMDLNTPDLTNAAGSVSLPYPYGPLAAGEYSFTVLLYPDGDSQQAVSTTQTYDYQPVEGMNYTLAHDGQTITVTDTTTYPLTSLSGFSRTSSLQYPSVNGVPVVDDVVSSLASFTSSMALGDGKVYEFVTWKVTGSVSYTLTTTAGVWQFVHAVSHSGSATLEVIIALDPCGVIDCVDSLWTSLYNQACSAGGFDNLSAVKKSQLINLFGNLEMYRYWIQCGDIDKALSYYNILADILSMTCTLDTSPKAAYVGSPVASVSWTTIQQVDYESNYVFNVANPLAWRVVNGLLQFKGVVGMDTFSQTGTTMVAASYWTSKGVSPVAEVYVPVIDAHPSLVGHEGSAHFDASGNLVIKGNAANVITGHDFAIGGMIPIT